MNLKKKIFKLVNNGFFRKTLENVRKHTDIKFVPTEAKRNYTEPDQIIIPINFSQKFIRHRNKKNPK